MGSIQTLWRGRLQHKYHFCSCCSIRYPLSQLKYQSRDLGSGWYCPNCYDSGTGTERNSEITRMISNAEQSQTENQPDKMLTDSSQVLDDDVQFMP